MTLRRATIATLLALTIVGAALAQQQPDDGNTPDITAGPATDTQVPPPAPAGSAPAQSDDSPFDYRSSEEISEDLSVSFPVDI
jgi:hypothetical protein